MLEQGYILFYDLNKNISKITYPVITRFKEEPRVIETHEIQAWKEFSGFKIIWRSYESKEFSSSFSLIPTITMGIQVASKKIFLLDDSYSYIESCLNSMFTEWKTMTKGYLVIHYFMYNKNPKEFLKSW